MVFAVEPILNCDHVANVQFTYINSILSSNTDDIQVSILHSIFGQKCEDCDELEENWICIECGTVACSRYVNSHMLQHSVLVNNASSSKTNPENEKNSSKSRHNTVAFSLSDLSVWCFECDSYVTSDALESLRSVFQSAKFPELVKDQTPIEPPIESRESVQLDSRVIQFAHDLRDGKYKNILVLTGAGVSTAAGIPDFRSKGTGLYDNLQKYNLPRPESVFDIDYFETNPEPFYQLARELQVTEVQPTLAHRFLHQLDRRNMLLRLYTQNIDGLDRKAGIRPSKLIESHGSFASASCIKCQTEASVAMVNECIEAERVPRCEVCDGYVKPDIVFFGESLPDRFHRLVGDDTKNADCLIVMGTSLAVMPVGMIPSMVNTDVPRLLINRELVGVFEDGHGLAMIGDIEEMVTSIAEICGWLDDMLECGNAPSV